MRLAATLSLALVTLFGGSSLAHADTYDETSCNAMCGSTALGGNGLGGTCTCLPNNCNASDGNLVGTCGTLSGTAMVCCQLSSTSPSKPAVTGGACACTAGNDCTGGLIEDLSATCPKGTVCCGLPTPGSSAAKAGAGSAAGTAPLKPGATVKPVTQTTASTYGYKPPLGNLSPSQIIGNVIKQLMPIIGSLFFAMFMWGGFLWMTAGGESKKVDQARQTLTSAVIGMAIVVFAYIIVYNLVSLLSAGVGK